MQRGTRLISGALASLTLAGLALAPIPAQASEEGRRNTALGLGALSALLFTRGGNKIPAFIAAGGAAYAYKRYDDSIRARHARERRYAQYLRRHRRHRSH